jgi:hypothetical protein
MARIRSIKPEIWMSPQVMNLSKEARLLFIGLITQADDEGRGTADARRVKAAIFGGDDDTSSNVRRMLDEIAAQRLIVLYHHEEHGDLFALPSWRQHQKIDRPGKSGYPAPSVPEPFVERSTSIRRGSEGSEGSEGAIVEGSTTRNGAHAPSTKLIGGGGDSAPPKPRASRLPEDFTLTPSRARFASEAGVDPGKTFAKFCDYWRGVSGARGTKLDWEATWRNWCRTEADRNPRAKGGDRDGLPTLAV